MRLKGTKSRQSLIYSISWPFNVIILSNPDLAEIERSLYSVTGYDTVRAYIGLWDEHGAVDAGLCAGIVANIVRTYI